MAKYLRTSSITAQLEYLIRDAKEKVYIISPYLKLSDNIRQLLNDKEREKVEVRIIFGKQELAPTEMEYLENLSYVRLYFFKNLHAKCYLNESKMIIASMNLYEFSQQHNREMGILIDTDDEQDKEVYNDAMKDIESILHNSEDFSYVKAPKKNPKEKEIKSEKKQESLSNPISIRKTNYTKSKYRSTSALSKIMGISAKELFDLFESKNWISKDGKSWNLTAKGEENGGQMKNSQYGEFVAWPEEIVTELNLQKN